MKSKVYVIIIAIISAITLLYSPLRTYAHFDNPVDSLNQIIANVEQICNKPCPQDTIRINAYKDMGLFVKEHDADSSLVLFKKGIEIAKTHYDPNNTNKGFIIQIKNIHAGLLEEISSIYEMQGDFNNALSYNEEAYVLRKELNDKLLLAENLYIKGGILFRNGDHENAIISLQNAVVLYDEAGDKVGVADSYNVIGFIYDRQGEYDKALENYFKSLSISKEANDKRGIAIRYNNIGALYYVRGNIPGAMEYIHKSYEISKEMGNQSAVVGLLNNLAYIYSESGLINKAVEYHYKSLELATEIGFRQGMARSYNNLGYIYKNQGNILKAMEYYQHSLKLKTEINDKSGMAVSYNNLGLIYSDQGDNGRAMENFNMTLNIYQELGDKKREASTLNNIGAIYSEKASKQEHGEAYTFMDSLCNIALSFHNRSLDIRKELLDMKGIAYSHHNIGSVYSTMARNRVSGGYSPDVLEVASLIDTALYHYNKSLEIREDISEMKGMAESTFSIGMLHLQQNNTEQFNKFADKCYRVAMKLGYPENIENASFLIKIRHINDNQLDSADYYAKNIVNSRNKSILSNFTVLSEAGKEKYFNNVADKYMDFNSYALYRLETNPSITETVYNNVLKTKGLLLRSSTAMRNAVLSSGDTILIDNYYKWIHIKKQIANLLSEGSNVTELEKLADEAEKELVKESQMFSDFHAMQGVSWQSIREELKADEVAIEFIHFKLKKYDRREFLNFSDSVLYCALIINSESLYPEMIPLFYEKELENVIGKISGNNLHYINSIYGKNTEANTQLYHLIWEQLEDHLEKVKTIYLSPAGLLHKISFPAIAKDKNIFLCDEYKIHIQSSTAKIVMPDKFDMKDNLSAVVFGGINYNTKDTKKEVWRYLKGTLQEAESISTLFKNRDVNTELYSGNNSKEEVFRKIAGNNSIIHIATHGFFFPDPREELLALEVRYDEEDVIFRGSRTTQGYGMWLFVKNQNPLMRSGLAFTGANRVWSDEYVNIDQDGVLTAEEVINIDMRNTGLLVMSACETGLGEIKGSEGVYGLQRAFKMAGVKNIIMSLWQVPDKETAEFMEMFYYNLLKGKDIRTAFAETQRDMRQKYDPFFWAAFVLME